MAKAAYHIIAPLPPVEPRLNPNGTGIEDVHPIPFRINSGPAAGSQGVVKIPHSQFTADNVRGAVETEVDTMHDVAAIAPPPPGTRQ